MYILIGEDEDQTKKAWEVLKEDAKIHMELSPTFFAKSHGSLQDKFGINWMFTVEK